MTARVKASSASSWTGSALHKLALLALPNTGATGPMLSDTVWAIWAIVAGPSFFPSWCFNIFCQVLRKPWRRMALVPIKTWTSYRQHLFCKSHPLKNGKRVLFREDKCKKAQPCVSSDARAQAHVSTSVNKKKQALLSDYINQCSSGTSAVIFTLLIDTN